MGSEQARLDHRDFGIVGHQQLRRPAEEGEGRVVAVDPVAHLLGPGRITERQARAAHHRDEQVGRPDLASLAVYHRHLVAGVVDKQLLAAAVILPHGQRQPALPAPEQVAKPAVAIPVGVLGNVLFPQDLQRHVLAFQLARHRRPVRLRQLTPSRLYPGRSVKARLKRRVIQLRRNRPGQPRSLEPRNHVARRRPRHANPTRNIPDRLANLPVQPHHFAQLAHL